MDIIASINLSPEQRDEKTLRAESAARFEGGRADWLGSAANLRTDIVDFRGLDSSTIFI